MKLICNKSNPPLSGLIAAEYVKALRGVCMEVKWGNETVIDNCTQKYQCETSNDVLRVIARLLGEELLYGGSAVEKSEVDSWLTFSMGPLASKSDFAVGVQHLNKTLAPLTFLVGKRVTIADFAVFSALYVSKHWQALLAKREAPVHVLRWYTFLQSQEAVSKTLAQLPEDVKNLLTPVQGRQSLEKSTGRQQEGKFIELPGAEMGKVVVRFPPEASGYLHIGHAKAALLNQYYQQAFQGKLIMRFDDTNPAKENVHFEQVILEDLKMLEIKPDAFTHTSDYFDIMIDYCEKLLKEGKAYVDDTEPEVMKQQREQRVESANRTNTYEKNVAFWEEMKKGTERGQKCCVRAKIDMQSMNGCMRDPTIYRCKNEPHPKTGEKYKVYPTYDFACPIVDAIEGVTHTLRTMEYHDRDPQFYWFIDALGLRKPHIWEYSRLSMTNTVLSKRKLAWFVEEKLVDGWDDPRFPTVRGVLRRGMSVEGLKQFIIAQGSSRSVVFMEWDKIWAFNKKVIDPIAPRFTAVEASSPVPVIITDVKEEKWAVPKHPKNPDVGEKEVWIGSKVLIDRADAELLKKGENTTFINWGNLLIKKICREDGKVVSIEAEPNLQNKDYKKTLKLTWLAETENARFAPTWCVYFDHIVSKPLLGKDEDFKLFVGHDTRKEFEMLGDPELRKLKKGDVIQLQRRGFFIVDVAYSPASLFTCREQPVILFYIPDGSVKENPVSAAASGDNKKGTSSHEATRSKSAVNAEIIKEGKSSHEATRSKSAVNAEIIKQGDVIRSLKGQKAAKAQIESAVKILLALKSEYKTLTSTDWKPGCEEQPTESPADLNISQVQKLKEGEVRLPSQCNEVEVIQQRIAQQGDRVRELKSKKADKAIVEPEVKTLLSLKAEYKSLTGKDWKPQAAPPVISEAMPSSPVLQEDSRGGGGDSIKDELVARVTEQGNAVRNLKTSKAPKEEIDAAVKTLLNLKTEYKTLTGTDFPAPGKTESKSKEKEKKQPKEKVVLQKAVKVKEQKSATKEKRPVEVEESTLKKQTRLGLEAKKEENLSEWYSQVITKGEMIEYYDVSGCYIFRPWAFAIWEALREWFDAEIKKLGVQNCYFPIFVSKTVLEKEKTHIADFAPEVAWVTKSGETELAEPIAVRPTSETVMYPAYAKWIQSYRDLPIKLNQWNNVVRWEFKHPQPFLRTREFLWQEGHTAYAVKAEAEAEVKVILDLYAQIYTDLLAIPVIKGKKTVKEKFAGGEYTFTVEAFVSASGRGIQGATSHHLGQNFSKMFDVAFEDPDTQEKVFVYQNSWGITTRTIGVMIMVHSDNQGLVLPPNVACIQTIIVPCGISVNLSDEDRQNLLDSCSALEAELKNAGVKVKGDYRDNYSPGWKFNHWELKGVPVRVELGPKDIKHRQLVAVRRDTGEKVVLKRESAVVNLKSLLEKIQRNLYEKAKSELDSHVVVVTDWSQFPSVLDKKNMLLSPFCGESSCEDRIKAESAREDSDPGAPSMGAKSLCIPFAQPAEIKPTDKCIHPECKNKPLYYTLFGRSY